MTCYVTCPDIRKTVTPDFKTPGLGKILYVDLGAGNSRLGGTALSTVYNQVRVCVCVSCSVSNKHFRSALFVAVGSV